MKYIKGFTSLAGLMPIKTAAGLVLIITAAVQAVTGDVDTAMATKAAAGVLLCGD